MLVCSAGCRGNQKSSLGMMTLAVRMHGLVRSGVTCSDHERAVMSHLAFLPGPGRNPSSLSTGNSCWELLPRDLGGQVISPIPQEGRYFRGNIVEYDLRIL